FVHHELPAKRDGSELATPLNGGATGRAAVSHLVEKRLGGLAADDTIGDRVGVLLVGVAGPANATGEADAAALLDDVGGLMGSQMNIRRAGKGDVVAGRVRAGADRVGGFGRGEADVGAHAAHVVVPEALLDRLEVRQRSAAARDP